MDKTSDDTERVLLRVEEVARLLSVSRSATYELLGRGLIESVHIGRSRRVPREAVDRFVESLREAGTRAQ